LLIIIGNPLVLSLDPLWRSFLEYIYNSGGWRGRPLRPDWDTIAGVDGEELINSRRAALQSEQEALMRRVTEVVEHKAEADSIEDFDVGDGYQEVERPWKEAN
jgi:helicase MOV-10